MLKSDHKMSNIMHTATRIANIFLGRNVTKGFRYLEEDV